jgi:hypothetical protein
LKAKELNCTCKQNKSVSWRTNSQIF